MPAAWKVREIPFADRRRWAMSIPWGDVASAYYSTGIGNIVVYLAAPHQQIAKVEQWRWALPVLGLWPVQVLARWQINRKEPGPSAEERKHGRSQLWGRVYDGDGPRSNSDNDDAGRLHAHRAHGGRGRAARGRGRHRNWISDTVEGVWTRVRIGDARDQRHVLSGMPTLSRGHGTLLTKRVMHRSVGGKLFSAKPILAVRQQIGGAFQIVTQRPQILRPRLARSPRVI